MDLRLEQLFVTSDLSQLYEIQMKQCCTIICRTLLGLLRLSNLIGKGNIHKVKILIIKEKCYSVTVNKFHKVTTKRFSSLKNHNFLTNKARNTWSVPF